MNIADLQKKLNDLGIHESAYSLSGGLPNEAYCLGKTIDGWEIYYSERGNKNQLEIFAEEFDACESFF